MIRAWALAAALYVASGSAVAANTLRDCADCPELVRLPAGEFTMGAELAESKRLGLPDFWATREQPRHVVKLAKPVAIGRYEITRGEFARFARDTGYGPPDGCWQFIGSEWVLDPKRSWRDAGIGDDATQICRYINLGDMDTRDRFGWDKTRIKYDVLEDWKGEPCRDGFPAMAPVAATAANPFGVHGLLGNANEWTADCWNDTHAGAPANAEPRLLGADCGQRVMKGQGWTAIAASVRPAFRLKMVATDRRFTFGFRVARDL